MISCVERVLIFSVGTRTAYASYWSVELPVLKTLRRHAIEAKASVSTHPKIETMPTTRRWAGVRPRSAPLTPSKVA
jgi:hypothetical protein